MASFTFTLHKYLNSGDTSDDEEGTIQLESGGALFVTDDLTLDSSLLTTTADSQKTIVVDNAHSSTLDVNGTLTLNAGTSPQTSLDFANVEFNANSLILNNVDTTTNKVTLTSGTFSIDSDLQAKNTTDTIVVEKATLNLGAMSEVMDSAGNVIYHTGSSGGEIGANLLLSGNGSISFETGA